MAVNRRTFLYGSTALASFWRPTAPHFRGRAGAEFTKPLLSKPYIDVDEWRDPVRHRYVHGGFTGTEAGFVIQFPPKEQYQSLLPPQHRRSGSGLEAGNIWEAPGLRF